jgi:hypothetical protein
MSTIYARIAWQVAGTSRTSALVFELDHAIALCMALNAASEYYHYPCL